MVVAMVIVAVGLVAYQALVQPNDQLAVMLSDDSYYYLKPARLFHETGMFTFDGDTPMYGFQPLWLLILTGVAAIIRDEYGLIRAAVLLGGAFYIGAGVLLFALARRWLKGWYALIPAALWLVNPPLIYAHIDGKENALYALLLIALLFIVDALRRNPARRSALIGGAVLGLLVLTRFDAAIVAAPLVLVAVITLRRRPVDALLLIGMAGIIAAVWIVYALGAFGVALPTSGTVKLLARPASLSAAYGIPPASLLDPFERTLIEEAPQVLYRLSFSQLVDLARDTVSPVLRAWLIPAALLSALGVITLIRRRAHTVIAVRPALPVWIALALGAGAHFLSMWLLVNFRLWYITPQAVTLILMVGGLAPLGAAALAQIRPVIAYAALIVALIFPVLRLNPPDDDPFMVAMYDAVIDLNADNFDGIAGSWNAGILGYFADFTVINLDSLANSPVYIDDLRGQILFTLGLRDQNALLDYAQAQGITHFIDAFPDGYTLPQHFGALVASLPPEAFETVYTGGELSLGGLERRIEVVRFTPPP